jgi:hypothetical protein
VGFLKDKTGTLYGGLAFAGVSLLVAAMLVLLLPKTASVPMPAEVKANP